MVEPDSGDLWCFTLNLFVRPVCFFSLREVPPLGVLETGEMRRDRRMGDGISRNLHPVSTPGLSGRVVKRTVYTGGRPYLVYFEGFSYTVWDYQNYNVCTIVLL